MMKNPAAALALAFACLFPAGAFAACTNPLPVTNGSGGTVNMSVTTGADGNCQYKFDIDTSSQIHNDITSGVGTPGSTSPSTNLAIGANAVNAEPAATTTGKNAAFYSDLVGKQIVLPYANPENFVSGSLSTAMTGTTSTSLIAAPAAGLRNYITSCTFSNSHATVGTDIVLQDGSSGTQIWLVPAAAVYGGATITFPTPLRQPTLATALFVQNVTTGASTKASCAGYKGA